MAMKTPVASAMKSELTPGVRFTLVSGLALATDFVLAFTLRSVANLPLSVSAAITFVVIGCAVYFIHEHWTFRREGSQTSGSRLAKNLLVNCCAWIGRVGVIASLEMLKEPEGFFISGLYFAAGAGVSFTINFVANRFWVFKQRQ